MQQKEFYFNLKQIKILCNEVQNCYKTRINNLSMNYNYCFHDFPNIYDYINQEYIEKNKKISIIISVEDKKNSNNRCYISIKYDYCEYENLFSVLIIPSYNDIFTCFDKIIYIGEMLIFFEDTSILDFYENKCLLDSDE